MKIEAEGGGSGPSRLPDDEARGWAWYDGGVATGVESSLENAGWSVAHDEFDTPDLQTTKP